MALFQKKKMRPGLVRYLHRQLDSAEVPQERKDRIAEILAKPDKLDKLNDQTHQLARKKGKLKEIEQAYGTTTAAEMMVGGEFLDKLFQFLSDHWDEIFALILKLLGV